MSEQIVIQLRFEVETEIGTFRSALNFSQAEWDARDLEAIKARQQELADKWVASVQELSAAKEPTKEELATEAESIDAQIATLVERKSEIVGKITDAEAVKLDG